MKRHALLLFLCASCSEHGSTFPYMPTPDATVVDAGKNGSGGASNGTGGATGTGGSASLDGGRRDADAKAACVAPAVDKCPSPKPSYKNDITPIFEAKCNSCHDGADANGPWPLTNLDDIVHWKVLVVQDIQTCAMPPEGQGTPLTPAENEKILGWLACDAPNN